MQQDALVQAAKAGDDAATASLMMTLLPFIRRKAAGAASVCGLDAEDLVQEGLIGFLSAVRTFSEGNGASFKTYACTCILNAIRTTIRKATKPGAVPPGAMVSMDDAEDLFVPADDPEEILIGKEQTDRMRQMINQQLSAMEQEVLRLYLSGNSYGDIAGRLSLRDSKAVDNALQRIRKKLKSFSL